MSVIGDNRFVPGCNPPVINSIQKMGQVRVILLSYVSVIGDYQFVPGCHPPVIDKVQKMRPVRVILLS